MAKKTIIKRASKTWPQSDKNDRLAQAINVLNQHEGFTDDAIDVTPREIDLITEDQIATIEALAEEVGADMNRFLRFMKVEKLSEMPSGWYETAIKNLEAKRK